MELVTVSVEWPLLIVATILMVILIVMLDTVKVELSKDGTWTAKFKFRDLFKRK